MKNKHPYELRLRIREKLPWFLINVGIAAKGSDCEKVKADHKWYNSVNGYSSCYYCKIEKIGELWRK